MINYDLNDYKVIEILNEQEILINYGSNDGAELGDKISIIEIGEHVIDPETKKDLGTLDVVKDTLEVCIPYEKFSLCRKVKRTIIDLTSLESFTNYNNISYENINVESTEITRRKIPSPTTIKVGDIVKIDE